MIGLPTAPAEFHAWQDGCDVMPDFELFNLTADIVGHVQGSAVSRRTLEAAGYFVPPAPVMSPSAARAHRHAWASTRRSMLSAHPFAA